jgi:hypothetical protein
MYVYATGVPLGSNIYKNKIRANILSFSFINRIIPPFSDYIALFSPYLEPTCIYQSAIYTNKKKAILFNFVCSIPTWFKNAAYQLRPAIYFTVKVI